MFVEIGLIQRLSLFLGHPVYGLAVALFALILATGIGSLISDRVMIRDATAASIWSILTGSYLAALPVALPYLTLRFEMYSVTVRALVAVMTIAPAGVLMGYGFPTGMRLVSDIDSRPTPWFWAINGATGVLAASLAVGVNITFSISVSIWLAALCYLCTGLALCALMTLSAKRPADIRAA